MNPKPIPRGICEWCCNPVEYDDSFVKLNTGVWLHINNARPSCLNQYELEQEQKAAA